MDWQLCRNFADGFKTVETTDIAPLAYVERLEYVDGKGDEIPRVAQIIAVADCFDAMYSNRPYRNRMNFDKVISIIKGVSGSQLASDVVDAFLRLVEKGEFRDPDDVGGGSLENIENIRNGQTEK